MWRALAVPVVLLMACPAFAQDMPLSLVLIPGEGWQAVPGDWSSPGSLASGRNGDVYVSHDQGRRIDRLDRDGKRHAFASPSAAVLSMTFAADGRLYACLRGKNAIIAVNAEGKESVVVEPLPAAFLAVTRQGVRYATVPSENAIYRIGKDGKKECVARSVRSPTGVTLWRDGGTLVVAEMEGRRLIAFRINKDGRLDGREQYYTLRHRSPEAGMVPSLTVDSADRLYAATPEGVQIFDPTGRMSGVLLRPERQAVRAVAFGGANLDRLFIICGNKLYVRKVKAKGVDAAPSKSQ